MRIMAKYGCEKVRNDIEESLCVWSFFLLRSFFSVQRVLSLSFYLYCRVCSKAKHTQKYVYKFITVTHFSRENLWLLFFFFASNSFSLLVPCYLSSLSQVNIFYIFFFRCPSTSPPSPLSHFLRIINSRSLGMRMIQRRCKKGKGSISVIRIS